MLRGEKITTEGNWKGITWQTCGGEMQTNRYMNFIVGLKLQIDEVGWK